jgi:hypothetical protein
MSWYDPSTWSGSDFDPTKWHPVVKGVNDLLKPAKVDTSGIDEEKRIAARAEAEYADWQRRWGGLTDPNGRTAGRANELGGIYAGEVDRGMYDAGTKAASTFRGRGMGDSGYAAAAQQNVIQAAAADRVQAREKAWQNALTEGQGLLSGELPAMGAKYGAAFKPYSDQAMLAMLQAQLDQKQKSDVLGGASSLAALAFL